MMRRHSFRTPGHDEPSHVSGPRSPLGSRIPLVSLIQALAVAEHLNFRHAAAALGVSQSSVSVRVKQLEQDLDILLFERRHRGVLLTEAGRSFLEHVATGIEHLDHAVKTAGAIARGEQGRLRIGLHSSIAAGFLADLLSSFRERHPRIDLQIAEGRARDTIMRVREEGLDITFVVGTPAVTDCRSKPLWTEALVAVLPRDHALARAEAVTWNDSPQKPSSSVTMEPDRKCRIMLCCGYCLIELPEQLPS
jgi:DNA-binding transcriptional LysR family regulator